MQSAIKLLRCGLNAVLDIVVASQVGESIFMSANGLTNALTGQQEVAGPVNLYMTVSLFSTHNIPCRVYPPHTLLSTNDICFNTPLISELFNSCNQRSMYSTQASTSQIAPYPNYIGSDGTSSQLGAHSSRIIGTYMLQSAL